MGVRIQVSALLAVWKRRPDHGVRTYLRWLVRRRRWALVSGIGAAATVTVVAVAVVVASSRPGAEPAPGGPLAPSARVADFWLEGPAAAGEPVSVSVAVVRNRGEATAKVDEVELLNRDSDLKLVGAVLIPPQISIGAEFGFPPPRARGRQRQAVGAELAPRQIARLVVGLAADVHGEHGFKRVAIHYHAGGVRYRAVYPYSVTLCIPKARGCSD
jgi:hypothetical protein